MPAVICAIASALTSLTSRMLRPASFHSMYSARSFSDGSGISIWVAYGLRPMRGFSSARFSATRQTEKSAERNCGSCAHFTSVTRA